MNVALTIERKILESGAWVWALMMQSGGKREREKNHKIFIMCCTFTKKEPLCCCFKLGYTENYKGIHITARDRSQ